MPFGTFGQGNTCVFGRVIVIPTGLLGAVNGFIVTLSGLPIRFRQVVGPAGGAISVNSVNGQFATLCGNLLFEQGQIILNVTAVIPGFGTGISGLSGTGLTGTGLLGSLLGSGI